DAQLTEIITTVLHTGSASDYNLNELFNQHHNKEPKSPNTRSRRRQEIQVATATPADDACARRNALAMKRELAIQRMGPQAKKVRVKAKNMSVPTSVTPPDSDLIKEACRRETEARVELGKNLDLGVNEGTPCIVSVESDRDKAKEDVKAVMVTDELETEQESTPDKGTHSPMNEGQKCKSHQSRRIRKSLRNIVPPQRLSSYITWHTPISHASSVETDITLAKLDSKTPPYPQEHKGNLTFEPTPKEPSEPMCKQSEGKCQSLQKNEAIEKRSSQKEIPEKETDSSDNSAYGRLRPSTRRLKALKMLKNTINVSNPPSPKIQYISPIKLMYVSQVKDNEGVKYSLKSAGSGSSLQTEEAFDPCVESSWAGTPQKHKSQSKENAVSPAKKSPSPAKAITSHESPTSSPAKSATCESVSLAETTPPKRRPGRPRKLGPQLEQKVKRPIGRPRKQKDSNAVSECKSLNGKGSKTDAEDDVTKNLKITVVYGRSRRNKRVVSESFDQLQTDFNNTCHTVDLKSDLGFSLHCSTRSPCIIKSSPEEFCFIRTAKEPPTQSVSSIKSQVPVESAPLRKPGRPAKIKISGISVTVTSASPRRRQIQINRETRISPKAKPPKKTLLLESEKEPCIGNSPLPIKSNSTEVVETNIRNTCELPNQTIPLRHSKRDRKPSIHLVHAVATSTFGSYKCSHALLRRSRKLLINKVSSERRQEDQQASAETQTLKRQPSRKERESITQDLSKVAKVSLDSIFSPRETVRWWAPSAKEKTMSQELARRIRVISDTWVTDSPDDQDKEVVHNSNLDTIGNSPVTRKSKKSSAVRALFDCSPNKPRSCSMQQICSWFMQTTETQSLAIVKKASSRNPFEIMHFPRSTNNKNVRHSPQAERLRKHIKKFPKTVPKSPLQHQLALLRLRKKKKVNQIRRRLFASRLEVGKHNRGVTRCRFSLSAQFRATLFRVRRRFFTLRERERWQSMASSNRPIANVLQLNHHKALHRSAKQLPDSLQESSPACSVDQTLKHADIHKEQKLSSKAWSPEKLKECRVFLRKINSPDNESTEEEGDSCTVTLDNGSPSTDFFEGNKKDLEGVAKGKRSDCAPKSVPNGKQRGKHNQSEVASPETPQPPPAKVLRQSRMRGLTGPRWCDYVIGNYP
uniref:Ligand dependent nuclear receptor corepressor-like n=1 Tax=Poecilia formosa TaxID=48698 RepID=A0A096M559_POEFO